MKRFLFYCFVLPVLIISACNKSNCNFSLKQIKLIDTKGNEEIISFLNKLESVHNDNHTLSIEYVFHKKNIQNIKSGILQIDNRSFFNAYINERLVINRNTGFFMDTLIATNRDSFIYNSTISSYFIDSTLLRKVLISGANTLNIVFFDNYTNLKHNKTNLVLSETNQDYPSVAYTKKIKSSKLPFLSINTNGIVDEPKNEASLVIKTKNILMKENIKIEIRGNTSQTFKKKSFSFKIYNNQWDIKKLPLIGLPSHEHWNLIAPYADKSLIRNVLAYRLFEKMGYYSPKTKFCDLSINGIYQGLYVLTEKITVDSTRLILSDGYLIKIDRPKGEFWKSNISNNNAPKTVFEIVYPGKETLSSSQKNRISSFVHYFEETLFLSNENTLNIFEIIDLPSFVDYLIINEFCKNIDAYRLSTYFQITPDKKIKLGPIWDFNFSFGLANYLDGHATNGFVYKKMKEVPFWWEKLTQNMYYNSALNNRWKQLRGSILNNDSIFKMIEKYTDELKISHENNFDKWPLLGQKEVWPNHYIGNTYNDEIDYLNNWIINRVQWLDEQWKD